MSLKTKKDVLVTGATGFVAYYVIKDLLDHGYKVRGTVRSDAPEKVAHLMKLEGAKDRLTFAKGDLLDAGAMKEAAKGVEYVMHTASPYTLTYKDPVKELIEPAVNGTKNVLQACKDAGVKRVVVTSSMAAVLDQIQNGHVYTEADWNKRSTKDLNAYFYSKTVAEQAAHDFGKEHGLSVVTVNPWMIIGPEPKTNSLNTSNGNLLSVMKGEYPFVPAISLGWVHVRDVARAHVLAMENDKAQGRHLLVGGVLSYKDIMAALRKEFPTHAGKVPTSDFTGSVGTAVFKLAAWAQPKAIRQFIHGNAGRVPQIDTSKSIKELGLVYTPPMEAVIDSVRRFIEQGRLPKRPIKGAATPSKSAPSSSTKPSTSKS